MDSVKSASDSAQADVSLAGHTNIVLILLYTGIQVYGFGEAFEFTVLQMNKGKIL